MDKNTNYIISFSPCEIEDDANSAASSGPSSKDYVYSGSVTSKSGGSVDQCSNEIASEACNEEGSLEQSTSSSQDEVEESIFDCNKDPCTYCGKNPCDWVTFEAEICEECEELVEQSRSNKEVRFHAYRLYTRLRHGVLRKFDRRPLPICVRGEIMDNWPDPNHNYVGFQAALRDVADT
jgi:hypothetical protein